MKRQIRRGVFETNSSTQHTLVLLKSNETDIFWKKLKAEHPNLVVGVTSLERIYNISDPFVVELGKLTLQEKIDVLFYSTMCDSTANFFSNMSIFKQLFDEHGIKIDILFDKVTEYLDEYYWTLSDGMIRFINESVTTKEDFEQLLVSDSCWYTSYADDCMDEPEEISKLYESLENVPDDDILVAHGRS